MIDPKPAEPPKEPSQRLQCALCWNKARVGVICDACQRSMDGEDV